jgi:MFS family permease
VSEIALTAAERRRGVAAATGCISIVGMMTGLAWPLLSLRLDAQGVDSRLIGFSSAVHALAIVAGSLAAPRLVGRFGLLAALYGCIATAIAALLLLPLFPNVYVWFPIRFALGAATSIIFVAGETWIIHVAPAQSRGRIVGIFPEGPFSREGRLVGGHPGVALIALRSGVPVVPAAIHGTYEALRGRRFYVPRAHPLSVRFGAAMHFGWPRHRRVTRAERDDVTRRIMGEIAALLAAEREPLTAAPGRAGAS